MRGTIVVTALALTAATLSVPVDALAGLMPSSTLQKELSTNIEQVRGFVARGPRGACLGCQAATSRNRQEGATSISVAVRLSRRQAACGALARRLKSVLGGAGSSYSVAA